MSQFNSVHISFKSISILILPPLHTHVPNDLFSCDFPVRIRIPCLPDVHFLRKQPFQSENYELTCVYDEGSFAPRLCIYEALISLSLLARTTGGLRVDILVTRSYIDSWMF